jgi:EmrB/QacA subfamily drug resistance transporter
MAQKARSTACDRPSRFIAPTWKPQPVRTANSKNSDRMNAPPPHAEPAAPLTHSERRRIVIGILLPLFLGSLDQTILANALPAVGRDIGHISDLSWLITAYLLTATAATPLHGKISDIHGRRFTFIAAILLYIAGSAVCALAPNFYVLVAGRALQGVGGGGLVSLAMVVLGDMASPKERGKYYVYFSIAFTTSGALGPLLGGAISEHVHWRALFWMNIPLGLIALALVTVALRRLPRNERPHRLDLIGAALIVIASASFMLALNVGGARAPWLSVPVLALVGLGALTGAFFVWRLLTAPEPLIPLAILKEHDARCAIAANAFGWGAIVALNIYLPIYLQTVLGLTPTYAGLSLMVLMVTVNIGAGAAGQVIGRVERYRILPMIGLVIAIAATLVLAWRAADVSLLEFQIILGLMGAGFGGVAPLSTVVLQNSVAIHQFGTAVGTMNFSRSLYGTILVAIYGAIVLGGLSPAELTPSGPDRHAGGYSIVFVAAAASLAAALVAVALMRERPLQTDAH